MKQFTTELVKSLQVNQQIIVKTTSSNQDLSGKFKNLLDEMQNLWMQSNKNN